MKQSSARPPGAASLTGEQPVGPLVQERAGLLARPGRGEVANRALPDLDLCRHGAADQLRSHRGVPRGGRTGASLRRRIPAGRRTPPARRVHRRRMRFQPRRQQLHHQPAVVSVHHQRGEGVAFAMDQPVGCRVDPLPARRAPPAIRSRHQARSTGRSVRSSSRRRISERGRVERLADESAAWIVHRTSAGRRRLRRARRCGRSRDGREPTARRPGR